MNNKLIKVSLLSMAASIVFIAGCGPQDSNAAYANQDNNWNAMEQAVDIAQAPQAPQAPQARQAPQQAPNEEGGCPAGGGGCPTGDCENPPDPDTQRAVQLPDQTVTEETKVMPTSENQVATDIVDYHTTRHVIQPSERHHTVNKHRNLVRRHFTKVVYHPTTRRINNVVRTNEETDQVMPTEEVVAPVVDYGCAAEAPPMPVVQTVLVPVVAPVYGGFPYRY